MAAFTKFKNIEEMAKHLAPRFQQDIADGRVERGGDDVGLWLWVKRESGEGPTLAHIKQFRYLLEAEIDRFPKIVIYLKDGVVETCIANGEAEDEVTEYLNDAGIEAEVSYENPQIEGKPKAYDLVISGNLLSVVVNGKSGTIEQGLPREACPSCDQADCCHPCDGSQGADDKSGETEQDANGRTRYNAVLDAVESIILAHACAGIKVDDPKYIEGIETTLEAAGNALS